MATFGIVKRYCLLSPQLSFTFQSFCALTNLQPCTFKKSIAITEQLFLLMEVVPSEV